MTRPTTLIWALTGFLLVGAGACGSDVASDVTSVHEVTQNAALSTLTLRVRGMTWGTCPLAVRQALMALDGVVSADVSYEDKRAEVRYHSSLASPDDMILAIDLAGFGASLISDEWMLEHRLPAVTSTLAAALAASCCILPIALIAAGVASAGLMMSMMRYEWLTLPLGVVGLAGAVVAYARQRREYTTTGCRFVGRRINQMFLTLGTTVVVTSLLLRFFPGWTSRILQAVAR